MVCGRPIRKGRTLLIFGHVGEGQSSQLLKIEILFLQHNSKTYYAVNSKLDIWPACKEREKNPIDFESYTCRSR